LQGEPLFGERPTLYSFTFAVSRFIPPWRDRFTIHGFNNNL